MTSISTGLFNRLRPAALAVASAAVLGLSACTTAPPPPPPAPPAPPVFVLPPPKPLPPAGTTGTLVIPAKLPSGVRQTVNAFITPAQTTWNLRSAFNVAALNCIKPGYESILTNYQTFLTRFRAPLAEANRAVTREFAARYGRQGRANEDAYLTRVYNYFALPPVSDAFCDRALAVSGQAVLVAPGELNNFAATALPSMEGVFEAFFVSYEQYQQDLAAWEAKYDAHASIDPYALQRAVAATPPPVFRAEPQPLPTAGPIIR